MSESPDIALRALLLQRLPAAEAQPLEDRILLEDEFAERLELERMDLLDDYAADRLEPADREAVERCLLLTAEDRQRVAFARALLARVAPRRSSRWLLPVAAALAAGVALLLVWPQRLTTPPSVPAASVATAPENSVETAAPPIKAYAVTLLAEARRGANSKRIAVPAGTTVLRLQLEVPQANGTAEGRPTHEVVLRDDNGERYAAAGLEAQDIGPYRVVAVDVPRALIGESRLRIILSQQGPAAGKHELFAWQVQFQTAP